jgi:isopentenyl-diphosphate delta-isomerase
MKKRYNQTVSFDTELLILVDREDKVLGYKNKMKCHQGDGLLHRAFSIFIFNPGGQVLMHKRSQLKSLWPLFWSNSCCSHPRKGESYKIATQRRLKEELGITCELSFLYKFQYQARFREIGSENELCSVFIGKTEQPIIVNENEIAEWKFFDISELDDQLSQNPDNFTPWFKMEWTQMRQDYWQEIEQILSDHYIPKKIKKDNSKKMG